MSELRGSATITASSEYDGSLVKGNTVDGNTSTEWASAGQGAASWIQYTWGSPVTIREIRLLTRTGDQWGTPRFTFADSSYSDGGTHLANNQDKTYVLIHPVTTTSMRISVAPNSIATGGNCGFKEVYINDAYSTPPSTNLTYGDHLLYSSQYDNGTYNHINAVDGNTSTEWASAGDGAGAWLKWEYLSAVSVESVQLRSRSGADNWGVPRFTYDDTTYVDGVASVSQSALTTYTLTPKTTTSLKVSIASGGGGTNRGLVEAIVTGNVTPPTGGGAHISATGIQVIG